MSIQTFTNGFQDYLFSKNPIFHTLTDVNLISHTDLFVAVAHAEELLQEFKDSPNFLEKESENIKQEIEEIFKSLEKKLIKINNYSEAMIGINSTPDNKYNIKNIYPYYLNDFVKAWNNTEQCLTLTGISTKMEINPYKFISEQNSNKYTYSFVLPTNITYSGVNILKTILNSDIATVEFISKNKKRIGLKHLSENIESNSVYVDIPLGTYIIVVETTSITQDYGLKVIPNTFEYQEYISLSLPSNVYEYTDFFTLQISNQIPDGCFVQVDLQLSFFDLNQTKIEDIFTSISVDNNGNLIDKYKNVNVEDKILYLYKDGSRFLVEEDTVIQDEDLVVYTPKKHDLYTLTTENTLRFYVKHAKTFECIPTLKMYSLLNTKSTPKVYSITGITKNESY